MKVVREKQVVRNQELGFRELSLAPNYYLLTTTQMEGKK